MSHSIANLEHHHFKYEQFRQPDEVHVHLFGMATLSFAEGVSTNEGDAFEVPAAPFAIRSSGRLVRAALADATVLSL